MSNLTQSERDIWDCINHEEIIHNVSGGPLPECNRGSWFCPVATQEDAQNLHNHLSYTDITKVYDLGAGDLRFGVTMDSIGYEVIAYESMKHLSDYALTKLPENDVEVRNRDYYSDWDRIKDDKAAFVALGKMNHVPGDTPNGLSFDGMGIE